MVAYNLAVPLSAIAVGVIDAFFSGPRPWLRLASGLLLFPTWTYQVTAFMICENIVNPDGQVPSYCPTSMHYAIEGSRPKDGPRFAMLSLAYVAAVFSFVYAFFSLVNLTGVENIETAKSFPDKDMESVSENEW
jgi:hypothetical protein